MSDLKSCNKLDYAPAKLGGIGFNENKLSLVYDKETSLLPERRYKTQSRCLEQFSIQCRKQYAFDLFCFTTLCDWLAKLASLSQPITEKQNRNQPCLAHTRFPALYTVYMYLLRVPLFIFVEPIGSQIWIWIRNRVIGLVLRRPVSYLTGKVITHGSGGNEEEIILYVHYK